MEDGAGTTLGFAIKIFQVDPNYGEEDFNSLFSFGKSVIFNLKMQIWLCQVETTNKNYINLSQICSACHTQKLLPNQLIELMASANIMSGGGEAD